MKKTIVIFILSLTALGGIFAWFKASPEDPDIYEIFQFSIVIILVVFAVFLGFRRIKSLKDGLPPEDELSKKIMKNAAARAYYFSLYWWILLMYLSSEGKIETESLIGLGILGMAVLLLIHYLIIKFTGLKNE
jgi:hypothetical protein